MGWKSFFQGLAQNLVSAILVLGGGAVIAVLKATNSHWTGPVLYGFLGMAALSMLIFSLTGRPILSRKQPQTNLENIEANIRAWLDYFELAVQKQSDPQLHFVYLVTCRSGVGVFVARPKSHGRYLAVISNLEVSKEHQEVLAALPKEKSGRILEETMLELARTGGGYNVATLPDGTMSKITIQLSVPITSSLTEDSFVQVLAKVESNTHVAREAVRLAIDSSKPQAV
jgi:hypothetical protein